MANKKVTIEEILAEKPKSIVLQARTLVQLTILNGTVAGQIEKLDELKTLNQQEHKTINKKVDGKMSAKLVGIVGGLIGLAVIVISVLDYLQNFGGG